MEEKGGRDYKEAQRTLDACICTHHHDYGDNFTDVYRSQSLSNCITLTLVVYIKCLSKGMQIKIKSFSYDS